MKKKNLYIVIFLTVLVVMLPCVSAGAFEFIIDSPSEPIYPKKYTYFYATHQLTLNIVEKLLPKLWMSQYTIIEVLEKPDWLSISMNNSTPITPPDGKEHTIQFIAAISDDAPMNTTGQVNLSIVTGKFARTIVPWFPGLGNEFDLDQAFQVKTGIWGDDNTTDQNDTDDTIDEDNEPEYKPDITNKQEESKICFILFIIIIILTIIVTILWNIKRE